MRPRFYSGTMARTKARRFACCALALLGAVAVSVCIAVLVRRACPSDAFSRAAVAADTATCSQIGRDILQAGGSAVDGAIAALLCTSVLNPQSMGLGGGSFFTVMDRSGHVRVINARETTPRKFKPDLLDSCPRTFQMLPGSEWIAVPGEIRGYEEAHRLYGRLPWATLFQPTIRLSRDGFPIPEILGRYLSTLNSTGRTPLRNLFSDKDGNLLKSGDVVRFHKLADTLETIARDGADAFYQGGIAEDLIRDVHEAGGSITAEDLAAYRVTVTDAWSVDLDDFRMYFPPPPAGGVVLGVVMNIMKGFRLNSADLDGDQKTLTYHRYAEALKFANGIKNHIRDPKFSSDEMAKRFTEETFAEHIRSLMRSNVTHDAQYYNITPYTDGVGTTHVSVLAEDGSAVSVTSSINHIFGSTVFSPRTGIILNNQLADFCGRVDRVFPGEQPPSSMSPIVLKSPLRTLVIGSTGATMITTSIASALMNHLWFQKSLKESIGTPIMFVDSRAELTFEPTFDEDLIEALKTVGHKRGHPRRFYNVANAVETVGGCVHAVSDTRKLGEAAGY